MRPKRIVVVEDDAPLRAEIVSLLVGEGYEVVGYPGGRRALEALSTAVAPDLILLDMLMPDMNGWEFRAAQKRDPVLSRTPVVVLSASDDAQVRAVDADLILKKPFETRALLASIEQLFSQMTSDRETHRGAMQAERLAALGTLAAGIVHEINNPLAGVLLNLEHLRRSPNVREVPHVREVLEEVLDDVRRIEGLVSDVRAFSRADDARSVPTDVRRSLDSAARLVGHQIRPRAQLVKDYGDMPRVMASDGRLGQVFVNLLVNAAQAIVEGDIAHNMIRIATSTSTLGEAVIEISDTGSGVSPDVLPYIFDPFYTTKPAGAGTGLGLSICHSIVQALGGRIEVESARGKGSVFRVVLPAAAPHVVSPSSGVRTPPVTSRRVLLVDDDEALVRSLVRAVGRDHHVTVATTGPQALEALLGDVAYDVVLCEVAIPQMSGVELYEALRAQRPGLERRLVFVTGASLSPRTAEALRALPNPRLEKPFDFAELSRILRDVPQAS